jgi:sulfate adenylyltransferase
MIKPHGSDELNPLFVYDTEKHEALSKEAESLPSLLLSSSAAGNAVMLGAGYYNPLTGYMNVADAVSCAENLKTTDGVFFPVPVLNLVEKAEGFAVGDRIALRDPNVDGNPVLAIQTVTAIEEVTDEQMAVMRDKVYRTDDAEHPGVAAFMSQGQVAVSGPIEVLNFSYFQSEFPDTFRTAVEIRNEIKEHGWNTIVAFQTRNPMHRAHEELCKMAMQAVNADGCVIHMLLGKLKPGDIPAPVRDASIRGPREAVLHALFRQNMGATHFIIGRDHAGVGDYYGAFDAQTIFDDEVPAGSLEIEIFNADHTAYSKKLNKVVMMRDVDDHTKEDFILLSGTAVREMLGNGEAPPPEFSRPEVAKILMDYYQSLN